MAYQRLIKRTIYVAKCPTCEEQIVQAEHPPRERWCDKCHRWVPYMEQSYVGDEHYGESKPE